MTPVENHDLAYQIDYLNGPFRDYLGGLPAKRIVAVAGNHDFVFQHAAHAVKDLPWTLLQDEEVTVQGLRIYGTPHTPQFGNWAFMQRDEALQEVFAQIPEGLDILLSHGPPKGIRDLTVSGAQAGSKALLYRIAEARPRLTVFGHIHEGRGEKRADGLWFANVSHVNVFYQGQHDAVNCGKYLKLARDYSA